MLVQLQISRKIAQSRFTSVLKTTHKKTFYDISHTTIEIDFGRDISKRGEFLQLLIRTRSNISSILFHTRENKNLFQLRQFATNFLRNTVNNSSVTFVLYFTNKQQLT